MEMIKFRTTIKCSGCVATVTPVLDEKVGKGNWQVDIQSPEKFLTITPGEPVNVAQLAKAIESVGYKLENVN
jgi:copper chaperone